MPENTPPYSGVKAIFSEELDQYISSRQYKETMYFSFGSKVQKYVVYISFVFVIFFLLINQKSKRLSLKQSILALFVLAIMVINAFVCGTFSMVTDRYQARIVWLIVFVGVLYLLQRKDKNNSTEAI